MVITYLLVFNSESYSQANIFLEYVSVNPENGHVSIFWSETHKDSLFDIKIEKHKLDDQKLIIPDTRHRTDVIDTVLSNQLLYIDVSSNAEIGTRGYSLSRLGFVHGVCHHTVHLNAEYDTCSSSVLLNWTEYLGWDEVQKYEIVDYATGKVIAEVQSNFYELKNADPRKTHSFIIKAYNDNGWISVSNNAEIYTDRPVEPIYIQPDKFEITEKDLAKISFEVDPLSQLTKYRLYQVENREGDEAVLIDSAINYNGNNVIFSDIDVNEKELNYFMLSAVDRCGFDVKYSDVTHNIVLKAENNEGTVNLEWIDGNIWDAENAFYSIYRASYVLEDPNLFNAELIEVPQNLFYNDKVSQIEKGKYTNRICYKMKQEKKDNSGYNISNKVCVDVEPEIFVPPYFTPNGTENTTFRPEFSFKPLNYQITIIDRAGHQVFTSDDPDFDWSAEGVPSGTYVYTIVLSKINGEKIVKSGHVSVVKAK